MIWVGHHDKRLHHLHPCMQIYLDISMYIYTYRRTHSYTYREIDLTVYRSPLQLPPNVDIRPSLVQSNRQSSTSISIRSIYGAVTRSQMYSGYICIISAYIYTNPRTSIRIHKTIPVLVRTSSILSRSISAGAIAR